MRWRPRFDSRTGTLFEVPALALNLALPTLMAGLLRAATTFPWPRLDEAGSVMVTTPLQPPESAGQATMTVATPDALMPTVWGGIEAGTELAGGSTTTGATTGGSTTGRSIGGSKKTGSRSTRGPRLR